MLGASPPSPPPSISSPDSHTMLGPFVVSDTIHTTAARCDPHTAGIYTLAHPRQAPLLHSSGALRNAKNVVNTSCQCLASVENESTYVYIHSNRWSIWDCIYGTRVVSGNSVWMCFPCVFMWALTSQSALPGPRQFEFLLQLSGS